MLNLNLQENRQKLLKMIDTDAEKVRIAKSLREVEIYKGKIDTHLEAKLREHYEDTTVKEMVRVDSINMAKRIANSEGSIYTNKVKRDYGKNADHFTKWDEALGLDTKLMRVNRYYKLQNQCFYYIYLKNNKPTSKVLKSHQFHVVEYGESKYFVIPNYTRVNPQDKAEKQKKDAIYTIWADDFNFVMNGEGEILDQYFEVATEFDLSNPLGRLPIAEISTEKDEGFWIDEETKLADFTIDFNMALTDLMHVMRMQGFSTGAVSGTPEQLNKVGTMTIGINKLIKLIKTPNANNDGTDDMDFQFITPSPDLAGSIAVIETILSSFLTSKGVDPKTINLKGDAQSFASGMERLLSLIEKFQASAEDIAAFKKFEQEIHEIKKAYIDTYTDAENGLDSDYRGGTDVTLNVEYSEPQMIETQAEKEDRLYRKYERGEISYIDYLMQTRGYNEEQRKDAIAIAERIKKENEQYKPKAEMPVMNQGEGNDQD